MQSAPTVSIVTPSLNQGEWIESTIRSVLDQDYPAIEYFVADGASTDNTLEILGRYGGRLQWVCEKDSGQSHAINKGFARSRGEILGWLNSDDTLAPGAIAAVVEYFNLHPEVAMVYGQADYIDAAGEVICPCAHIEPFDRDRLFYYSDFIVQPAAFFRRDAFEAVGGLDQSLSYCMDYDLWLKIAKRGRIAYLPRLLAHFRWMGRNKTAVGGEERLREIKEMAARHGLPMPAYVRLEAVRHHLGQSFSALRHLRLPGFVTAGRRAAANLLASPRAVVSLFSPRTWRIIYTGQVLRGHAQKNPKSKIQNPSYPAVQ